MIKKRSFRLADELLLFLLFLLPMMLVLGAAERTAQGTTLLFWLLILLPLGILPLLWRAADAEETAQGPRVAARRVEPEIALAEEFAAATAPVVDVRRAFVEAGVPIVECRLRQEPSQALARLEILLAPRRLTPLIEEAGDQTVRIIGLPMTVDAQLRRRSSIAVNLVLLTFTRTESAVSCETHVESREA